MRPLITTGTLLFGIFIAISAGVQASAQVLEAGTVGCITRKDYDRFQTLSERNPAFAEKLFENAACYTQQDPIPAAILSAVGEATRVELLNGTRVWVPTSAISTTVVAE